MATSGVYIITNPDGQIYVGSSVNIELRWWEHKATQGRSHSQLRLSFLKHGYKAHKFRIVEHVIAPEASVLEERERHWQEFYTPVLLNRRKVGTKKLRPVDCEATMESRSQKSKGRSGPTKGAKISPETRAKQSSAKQGKGRLIQMIDEKTGEVLRIARLNEYLADGYSRQCISMVCRGKMKRYKGCLWKYVHKSALIKTYQTKAIRNLS